MTRPRLDAISARMPRRQGWVDEAPCAGQWWMTDLPPHILERTPRAKVVAAMQPTLKLCADCPFTRECIDRVAPKESWYDGVAGGFVWRNGQVIGGLTKAAERAA